MYSFDIPARVANLSAVQSYRPISPGRKLDTVADAKIMVFEGAVVITGSFNFTKGAEHENAENLLVIRRKELAAQYTKNWEAHADHSDPSAGRGR